jgi:DNA replication protein DnaC
VRRSAASDARPRRLLFQVISRRVLTTNRGIADWGQIFEGATVAAATLDRLLHQATVLSITGDSYRMRRHRVATPRPHRPPTRWGIPIVASGELSSSLT